MGITGLLPFLKNASRPAHVSEFKGQTIGIDVYVWLHKGAFGCAEKLVMGQKTNGYILYVMKFVDLLLFHGIKPVLVFDGRNLPSKSETEKKRRENRTKYKKMAKDYLAAGQYREARDCFTRCIDITPEIAREVIAASRERNIDCIIAPYEADAQLAFLVKSGIVDMIISEDSDLTLFGCEKILFKLEHSGNGVLCEMSKLNVCLGAKADNFSFEKFRYMCIMSGCDYLASLHGIGLGKSCKFWGKVTNMDLKSVLPKIPAYLNMHQLTVTPEYIDGFIKADQTFLYQLVFDPRTRKLRPLNDYVDETLTSKKLPFCGEMVNDDLAFGLALGNIDLHSLQKVNDFNPDEAIPVVEKPKYGRRANHATIWNVTFTPEQAVLKEPFYYAEKKKAEDDKKEVMKCFSTLPKDNKGTTNTVAKKRKREPSPALVCTPEAIDNNLDTKAIGNILDTKAIANILDTNDEVNENNEDEQIEVIYKSRFFKKKNSSPKKQTGDWLEDLDDSSPSKDFKYTPDVKEDSEKVLRQAFKPVAMIANSEALARKRNPFAVKTPEKKNRKIEFSPIEVNSDQIKNSQGSSEVMSSPEKVLEIDLSPTEVRVDHGKNSNDTDLQISESFEEDLVKNDNSKSNLKSEPEVKSKYFQPNKKPRVSGLLKPSSKKKGNMSGNSGQPSLFDMWSKKN